MKVRDSGMPDEEMWSAFFDAGRILAELGLVDSAADVAEFGCGYGTFTVAVASRTRGTVYAFDIEPEMIDTTAIKARGSGLNNICCTLRDFVTDGTGLVDESVDYAMLFNILHTENPLGLLREAQRILRPGGRAAIIHWNPDPTTPRGPDMSIRPRPEQCRAWALEAGFDLELPFVSLPPYHFGLMGRKPKTTRSNQPIDKDSAEDQA